MPIALSDAMLLAFEWVAACSTSLTMLCMELSNNFAPSTSMLWQLVAPEPTSGLTTAKFSKLDPQVFAL